MLENNDSPPLDLIMDIKIFQLKKSLGEMLMNDKDASV
jgi:hypothetical protein